MTADNNLDKQAGVEAFASGEYAEAYAKFNSSVQNNRNDPETWIYLNNTAAAATGDVVKIAVSVPIGSNLNIAKEILRGVAQAQNEVNKSGGIGGVLLQIEIANDDNDPAIAKQIAAEFVNDSEILAVIGHNSSNASIAAAPLYEQGNLVMVSPTSTAREFSGIGSHIFRTTPSTRATADALARYAIETAHTQKIAICADSQDEASRSYKEEFTWSVFENGGEVLPTVCDFSAADFNPQEIPSQVTSSGANALLLAPSLAKINQAMEVARASQGRLSLLGNQTLYTYSTLQQGQVDVNGMVLAVPWHAKQLNNPYTVTARQMWGGAGSWRTAMAYDATKAIIAGLQSGLKRSQLQKALSTPGFSFEGATGTIQFLPSGDRNMKGTLVKILPGQKSGTGYDFITLSPEPNPLAAATPSVSP